MSYKYLIDSHAWIEYFNGTEKGKIAKKYIESGESATSSITIAELTDKYKREGKNFEEDFNFIIARTKVVVVDARLARSAGIINEENKKKIKNWGMADALILASALALDAKVVTGDEHFRSFNAIML